MKYYRVFYNSGTTTIIFAKNKKEAKRIATIGDLEVKKVEVSKS